MEHWTVRAVLAAAGAAAAACFAQDYPAKPVRLVLPVGPGSGVEASARLVTVKMQESLGQPFVLEFRPGAGGTIGAEAVARSAPDGYTLLYCVPDPIVMRPAMSTNVPYDPVRDFTPITAMIRSYILLIANPKLPAQGIQEMIAHARRNPGKLTYGSNGIGTGHHLLGDQLARLAKIDIVHVPYKSGAPAHTALIGGEIDTLVSAAGTSTPHVKSGKVRALVVLDRERSPVFPDLPAVVELVPGFQAVPGWSAFFGPARMPKAVVARLYKEIVRAVNLPEVRERLHGVGQRIVASTPEEFAEAIRGEIAVVKALAQATGIRPE